MKPQVIYNSIDLKGIKRCLKLYYNLKYENRKLKLKDLSLISSSYGAFQYLVKLNDIYASKSITLSIEESLELNWIFDKYFKYNQPNDISPSGLREYFEVKTDDISYLLDVYKFEDLLDKELQSFIQLCENYIVRSQKNDRYEPTYVVSFLTAEHYENKNILNLIKEHLIDTLELHLSYLFVNIRYDAEVLTDIYKRKVQVLKNFRFTRSEEVLQTLYNVLIQNNYIKEVGFPIFKKHFTESEIFEHEKLTWNRSNVLLAFFIKYLQENDFLSLAENVWQKTEKCFTNQIANSLASSFTRNSSPKGYLELEILLSTVK